VTTAVQDLIRAFESALQGSEELKERNG